MPQLSSWLDYSRTAVCTCVDRQDSSDHIVRLWLSNSLGTAKLSEVHPPHIAGHPLLRSHKECLGLHFLSAAHVIMRAQDPAALGGGQASERGHLIR